MSIQQFFEKTSSIQLNVMQIDGRQMTKSIVKQLGFIHPFDDKYLFTGNKIFGYVSLPIKINDQIGTITNWGIMQKDDKLYKFNAEKVREVAKLNLDAILDRSAKMAELFPKLIKGKGLTMYKSEFINEGGYFDKFNGDPNRTFREVFSNEVISAIEEILSNAREFYKELQEHQIFI